jgi:hypothetical protein
MPKLNLKADDAVKTPKAKPVILLLEEYEDLLDELQDLATHARRKNQQTIPLAEVKKRMNKIAALRR